MLGEYASSQRGMVTRAQARQLGVDHVTLRRLIDAGLLETMTRGVHRLTSAGGDRHALIRAQWMRLDMQTPAWERLTADTAGAVVSHRTATLLHELGDIPAPTIEFTAPTRRRSRADEVEFHVGSVTAQDMTIVDGLPVTAPLRTVADLAANGVDGGHLGGVSEDVLARGLASRTELAAALEAGVRKYGMRSGDGPKLLERILEQAQSTVSLSAAAAALEPMIATAAHPIAELIAQQLSISNISPELAIAVTAAQEPTARPMRDLREQFYTPALLESSMAIAQAAAAMPSMRQFVLSTEEIRSRLSADPKLAEAVRTLVASGLLENRALTPSDATSDASPASTTTEDAVEPGTVDA